jgi:hypothetical protein
MKGLLGPGWEIRNPKSEIRNKSKTTDMPKWVKSGRKSSPQPASNFDNCRERGNKDCCTHNLVAPYPSLFETSTLLRGRLGRGLAAKLCLQFLDLLFQHVWIR